MKETIRCSNIDDDCDDLTDNVAAWQANTWWVDLDEDDYRDPDKRSQKGCEAPESTGWADNDGDCDDENPSANPGTAEACDHFDNDCDDLNWKSGRRRRRRSSWCLLTAE